jgi:PPOX class probable F420-dependent enzyme
VPSAAGLGTMVGMHHMERDEWLAFVMHGTRTGKLATVRKDGSPHVVPIWFLVDAAEDGDYLVFTTGVDTVKGKAIQRDPRLALCVDTETPPYSFVQLSAEATIFRDLDDQLEWATRLAARYMGAELAEAYGKRNAVPDQLLVRARITKVVALAEIAD